MTIAAGDRQASSSVPVTVKAGGNGNDILGGAGSDSFDGSLGADTATDFNATEGDSKTNIP